MATTTSGQRSDTVALHVAILKERREALAQGGFTGAFPRQVRLIPYVGIPNIKDGITKSAIQTALKSSDELVPVRAIELTDPVGEPHFVLYENKVTLETSYGLLLRHPAMSEELCITLSEEQLAPYLHPQGDAFSHEEKMAASSALVSIMYVLVNHDNRSFTL